MDSSWDNKFKKITQANNIRFKEIIKIDDVKKEEKKKKQNKAQNKSPQKTKIKQTSLFMSVITC